MVTIWCLSKHACLVALVWLGIQSKSLGFLVILKVFESLESHDNSKYRVIAAAREMFSRRIGGDEEAIHPSLRLEVFGIVAEHGSRQELEKLLDVWRSSPSDIERYQALQCLGRASTVELITWVLKLAFTRDVKDQDVSHPENQLTDHMDIKTPT